MSIILICKLNIYLVVSLKNPSKPTDESSFGIGFFYIRIFLSMIFVVARLEQPSWSFVVVRFERSSWPTRHALRLYIIFNVLFLVIGEK